MEQIGKYMMVEKLERDPSKKTDRWLIYNAKIEDLLGDVKWYSGWRRYCFFPVGVDGLVFSPDCLTAIAAFIEKEMEARR